MTFKDIYVCEKLVSEEEPLALDLQKFWKRKSSSQRDRIPFYRPRFPRQFPPFCLFFSSAGAAAAADSSPPLTAGAALPQAGILTSVRRQELLPQSLS